MAWFVMDLEDTLVVRDPMSGDVLEPTDGSVDAMLQLFNEGHRLTIWTSRFARMPDDRKQAEKEKLEQELLQLGFPEMEVWTGTHRPDADVFIGSKDVTYDKDWGLALAQSQMMLEERGLVPPPTGAPMEEEPQDAGAPAQVPPEEM